MTPIKDRTGETRIATNGQKMTIEVYRGSRDMDIRFEDGTLVTGVKYPSFLDGMVKNPNCPTKSGKRLSPKDRPIQRIGEAKLSTNGQMMTIVDYKNATNVTVRFEDGTETTCSYCNFKKGRVANPKTNPRIVTEKKKKKILFWSRKGIPIPEIMKKTGAGEHTVYNIQEEAGIRDDYKAAHELYLACKAEKGYKKKVGESIIKNDGQKMTIIAFRNPKDIDVRFDDGTIVQHKSYYGFVRGAVGNPNYKPNNAKETYISYIRRGATTMDRFMTAKNALLKIKGHTGIQDDEQLGKKLGMPSAAVKIYQHGAYAQKREYKAILLGAKKAFGLSEDFFYEGKNAALTQQEDESAVSRNGRFKDRTGETITSGNGVKGVIVAYRGVNDIDIRLIDGTVLRNRKYWGFVKGSILLSTDGEAESDVNDEPEYESETEDVDPGVISYYNNEDEDLSEDEDEPEDENVSEDEGEDMFKDEDEPKNEIEAEHKETKIPSTSQEIKLFAEKAVAMMKSGMSRREICAQLGVGKTTYYKYLKIAGVNFPLNAPLKKMHSQFFSTNSSDKEQQREETTSTQSWTPVSERPPKTDGRYLVTFSNDRVEVRDYVVPNKDGATGWFREFSDKGEIIAWMPAPKAYKPKMTYNEARDVLAKKKSSVIADESEKEAIDVALGSLEDSEKLKNFIKWYSSGEKWTAAEIKEKIGSALIGNTEK